MAGQGLGGQEDFSWAAHRLGSASRRIQPYVGGVGARRARLPAAPPDRYRATMRTGVRVDEAQQIVLAAAEPLPAETVAAERAQGRILADRVVSGRTLPPGDCSAMD